MSLSRRNPMLTDGGEAANSRTLRRSVESFPVA
jgi:hypothetical protein